MRIAECLRGYVAPYSVPGPKTFLQNKKFGTQRIAISKIRSIQRQQITGLFISVCLPGRHLTWHQIRPVNSDVIDHSGLTLCKHGNKQNEWGL